MDFYVIFTIDCDDDTSIQQFKPRRSVLRRLVCTEGDEQAEYGYAGLRKHRKYVGQLNAAQFKRLVDDTGLTAENIETMGSLTEFGWLPAISMRGDGTDGYYNTVAIVGAYVTPLARVKELNDSRWERLRKAFIAKFS